MLAMRALPNGFEIEYTQPLSAATATALATKYRVKQWRYVPTAAYGGPKVDEQTLTVSSATLSADGKKVTLVINGLQAGRVVHIRSPRPFASSQRPVAVEHRGLVHAQRHPRPGSRPPTWRWASRPPPTAPAPPPRARPRRSTAPSPAATSTSGARWARPSGCRSTSAPARASTGSWSSTPAPVARTPPGTRVTSTSRSAPTARAGRRWRRSPRTRPVPPRTTSRRRRPDTCG